MTSSLQYFKVTMRDAHILEKGHPRHDFCECEVGRVVRRIQVWSDARHAALAGAKVTCVKQSLEGAENLRPNGLRETVPDLSWNIRDDGTYFVEEISKEEFEKMWTRAKLVPANWPYGW